ncbi:hypothetical protein D9M68_560130 [compost metagenome]
MHFPLVAQPAPPDDVGFLQIPDVQHGLLVRRGGARVATAVRHRRDQALRVGVAGPVQHFLRRPLFDQDAFFHDGDPMGDLGHHPEVVGDEHHAHAFLFLDAGDERQDLRLRGDVERGRGFVGDQQRGLQRQGHGDHHALALSSGQPERIDVVKRGGIGQADEGKHFQRARHALGAGIGVVHAHDLADLLAHRHQRVQRREGFLEDHGHVLAAHGLQGRFVLPQQILAAEQNAALLRRQVVGQ